MYILSKIIINNKPLYWSDMYINIFKKNNNIIRIQTEIVENQKCKVLFLCKKLFKHDENIYRPYFLRNV